MNSKTAHRRVLYIWLVMIALTCAAAYFFIFMSLSTEISQKKEALNFTEKKYELLKEEVEKTESNTIPVTSLLNSIPETMNEEEVIKLINQASNSSNTLVESYQYKEEEVIEVKGEKVEQLTMQLNGTTSGLSQLNKFIKQLETSDRLVHISGLDFQNRDKSIYFQTELNVYSKTFE